MKSPPVTDWVLQEISWDSDLCAVGILGERSRSNPCEGAKEAGLDRGRSSNSNVVTTAVLSWSQGKLWSWDGLSELSWMKAFIRTLFPSSTSNQPLHAGYTWGGCASLGRQQPSAERCAWRDSAVSHQQPTLLRAGELSASGIKRRSGCCTDYPLHLPF